MSGHFSALLQAPPPAGGPRLPVTVLTGFLGSGKTTLLNRLLAQPDLAGTAVIVNEFGEAGLDHDLLTVAVDEDTVLLPNGCLCCAVRGDLVAALDALLARRDRPLHRVVIETSGLAEPGPILRTLLTDPLLRGRCRVAGVVCTVDAVLGLPTLARHPEALAQLAAADEVLLTKRDLLPEGGALNELLARLQQVNPAARVHPDAAQHPDTLRQRVLAPEAPAEAEGAPGRLPYQPLATADRGGHLGDVESFVLYRDEPLDLDGFAQWLDLVVASRGEGLLRFKGLVHTQQHPEGPMVVHAVQHLFHPPEFLPAWPSADRRTRLVFIARGLDREALESTLDVMTRRRRRATPA